MGRQGLTFCWYPWALYSGGHWLRHAESSGAPAAKVARVRAALGHLVVDFGEKKADSAGRGWTFLAAETLMAFSVIAPP